METRTRILLCLAGLLILAVFFTGCSDDSSGGTATTVPTAATTAKYETGDIVAKSSSSTDTLILIIRYDSGTDKYERALVFRKSDGTYYRKEESADPLSRSTLEKLYPAKVTHVSSLSQVPVATPTTATTVPTTTITTTTTSYPAPTISSISPSTGVAGTGSTLSAYIYGTHFRSGASVRLINATTSTIITGKSVDVESETEISYKLTIPSTAIAGAWTVIVSNPDGKSATLAYGFTVTNTTSSGTPTVSSISPAYGYSGKTIDISNLAGTNLADVTSVKLQRSGETTDVSATNVVATATKVTCSFNLAGKTAGLWNVKVTNSASLSGEASNLFTIYPVADFAPSTTSGSAPLTVTFTDTSEGKPSSWSWVFGEGNTSVLQNPPARVYTNSGSYTVSLTVSNGGVSNTTTRSIVVI